MIALGFVFCTVIPPGLDVGPVRQPENASERSRKPQKSLFTPRRLVAPEATSSLIGKLLTKRTRPTPAKSLALVGTSWVNPPGCLWTRQLIKCHSQDLTPFVPIGRNPRLRLLLRQREDYERRGDAAQYMLTKEGSAPRWPLHRPRLKL